jgi:hypothetical protein
MTAAAACVRATPLPANQDQPHQLCPKPLNPHPGAGKTFTMTGDRSAYQQRGLIPRTIAALMAALRADRGLVTWRMKISYLEVGF